MPVPSSRGEVFDSEDLQPPDTGSGSARTSRSRVLRPTVLSLGSGATGKRQPNYVEAPLQQLGVSWISHRRPAREGTPGSQSVV